MSPLHGTVESSCGKCASARYVDAVSSSFDTFSLGLFFGILMSLRILQEVTFKVDYVVPSINREFGTVILGGQNVAYEVVAAGWAKVRIKH